MPREGFVSVFFGLGPRGDITESILRDRISEVCPIVDFRMRDRFAFVDCTPADADAIVRRLNGVRIASSTLTCQISKRDDPAASRRNDRSRRDDRRDTRRRDDSRDRRRRDDSRDRRRRDDSRDRRDVRRRDDSRDRRRRDRSRRRDDSRDRRRRDDSRDRRRRDDSRDRRDDSRDKRRRRDDSRDAPATANADAAPAAESSEVAAEYAAPLVDVTASYQVEAEEQQVVEEAVDAPAVEENIDDAPASRSPSQTGSN